MMILTTIVFLLCITISLSYSFIRRPLHLVKNNNYNTHLLLSSNSDNNSGVNPKVLETIKNLVTEHKVLLFMKGDSQQPQWSVYVVWLALQLLCLILFDYYYSGFSRTACAILNALNTPFGTVNVLDNEEVRAGIKEFSAWPTIPQLYVNGEFVGGCDIMIEMYENGELAEMIELANAQ